MLIQISGRSYLRNEKVKLGGVGKKEYEEQISQSIDGPSSSEQRHIEKACEEGGEAIPEDVAGIAAAESGGNHWNRKEEQP